MTLAPLAGLLGLALAPSSCRELEPIELDQCGNRIVEAELGEDCDGASALGTCSNFDPTTNSVVDDGLCKFTCDSFLEVDEGCPADMGFECGIDDICRRPSRAFELAAASLEVVATRLVARELGDGFDRSKELLAFDGQKLRVYRFDFEGRVLDTQAIAAQGRDLAVGDFSGTRDPALALRYEASATAQGVSLFNIDIDGNLSPVTIRDEGLTPSGSVAQLGILLDTPGRAPQPEEILIRFDDAGVRAYDFDQERYVTVWSGVEFDKESFGGMAVGDAVGALANCGEVVLAPDDSTVGVLALCNGGDFNTNSAPMATPSLQGRVLALEPDPEERIRRSSVFFARQPNDDNLVDVIAYARPTPGVRPRLFVSRQTMMGFSDFEPINVFTALACEGDESEDVTETSRPLAFADFNGDGNVDVVAEDRIVISRPVAGQVAYVTSVCGDFRWHSVELADLTGDGALDLVAQEQAEFLDEDGNKSFAGTSLLALINDGTGAFTQFRITTELVSDYEVADFDGDGVADVAHTLEDSVQGTGSVFVSYGRASGGLEPPVAVAEFENEIDQIAAGRFRGDDGAADLLVVTEVADFDADDERSFYPHHVLIGSSSRQLIAPVLFTENRNDGETYRHAPSSLVSTATGAVGQPDLLTTFSSWREKRDGPTNGSSGPSPTRPSLWSTTITKGEQPISNVWPDMEESLELGENAKAASLDLNPSDGNNQEEVVVLYPPRKTPEAEQAGRAELYVLAKADQGAVISPQNIKIDYATSDDATLTAIVSPPEPFVVDIDGDGLLDILFFSRASAETDDVEDFDLTTVELTLLRNTGAGPGSPNAFEVSAVFLEADRSSSQVIPPALASVRLGVSGRPEVVVIGYDYGVLRYANGALVYESYGEHGLGFPQAAAAGDFNGDGLDDLAIATGAFVEVLLGVDLNSRTGIEDLAFETDSGLAPDEPL